ncbi:MAG: UbiX family flavin prenyltransferase [Steroidobacteraceae bacterium]|nr:UbiX family flavin prenyltransferase [Steroidobacteraceae bacterium]MDW8258053.1 flavin prenyltransferase UbiX [Gammaproteobacteria bacterium]
MSQSPSEPITLAMTGASGAQYGLRLLECLLQADRAVYLLFTKAAQVVIGSETDVALPGRAAEQARYLASRYGARDGQLRVFGAEEWSAPVASGSGAPRAMVVCPCSMGTLASIANGASDNLLERAADVVIKERGNLILVPRETPFSAIHLENMLKLARLGVSILPANPGFYHRPKRIEELIDFVVARVLDQLGIDTALLRRWGREPGEQR